MTSLLAGSTVATYSIRAGRQQAGSRLADWYCTAGPFAGSPDAVEYSWPTGEKLWEIKLPSSIETTPITYQGADGRQFVTVVSTGGGLTGSVVTNDEIIAFALPKK